VRISKLQNDILVTLVALESMDHREKVPATVLLKILNSNREANDQAKVFGAALRLSLKTLASNKLVRQFKNIVNGELSYLLTNDGRNIGVEVMAKRDCEQT